jgi:predicted transcriptional regulator
MNKTYAPTANELIRSQQMLEMLRKRGTSNKPARGRNSLVSKDGQWVYDPFTGKPYRMLTRILRAQYNMTIEDTREFFGLTEKQLPATAPGYREEKRAYAAYMGLGKLSNKAGRKAPKRSTWAKRRERLGFAPVHHAYAA